MSLLNYPPSAIRFLTIRYPLSAIRFLNHPPSASQWGHMSDIPPHITRRTLLQGATLVGATVVVAPASLLSTPGVASAAESGPAVFKHLTVSESDLLQVIVQRLIPSDANGPGAKEARVAEYIDGALGDALKSSRQSYAMGLAALDRYAQSSRGKPFLQLAPTDQDSVLIDCETGGATGFTGSSAQFFGMLLNHTRQGMFGDPHYGGNANYIGWDLIGYPGVRTAVTAADQKALEANALKPVRRSAYDYTGFNKEHHGD
jgi:gluconate 2-dehydrogenase gamma chain